MNALNNNNTHNDAYRFKYLTQELKNNITHIIYICYFWISVYIGLPRNVVF